MADPNDTTTPAQGNPAAQGNNGNGNGQKARVAELERLLAERDGAIVERDRRLLEARDLRATQEEGFRTFEREAKEAFDALRAERDALVEDNRRLAEDNARLRGAADAARRAAPERIVGRDDPQKWRALARLCATLDGKARTFAADSEFVARRSDLEDDGLVCGVDFVHAVEKADEKPAPVAAPGR